MASTNNKLRIIFGVIFISLAISLTIPVTISAIESPSLETLTVSEGNIYLIQEPLEIEIVDISQQDMNYTLIDTESGNVVHNTVGEGISQDNTIGGETVTVTLSDILSGSQAVISVEYPVYYSWPPNANIIFRNTASILLINTILFITGSLVLIMGVLE